MFRVNTRKKFLLNRRGVRETREKVGKKIGRKVVKARGSISWFTGFLQLHRGLQLV
jgi:hypothetical protein